MRKFISIILTLIFVFSIPVTTFASENPLSENLSMTDDTIFSYCNDEGKIITISSSRTETTSTAKVYVNGVLTQKSIANAVKGTIDTEIYDLPALSLNSELSVKETANGYISSVIHVPVSTERIDIADAEVQLQSVTTEPVDNTGLISSGYGDGYYYLGTYGGLYYAPDVYGHLYRTFTRSYDGETKRWTWGAGDTISAISAAVSLFGGPVSAVIGILAFTAAEVLAYTQSVSLATYTYDYSYKVRVSGNVYYTAQRNITYWRIDNAETRTTKWEQKRFNYGFSMGNTEMVKIGIDKYLSPTM